jgi:flagellar biogenesis protein FliO
MEGGNAVEVLQPLLAVISVLALLLGALWWLRRKGVAQFASGARAPRRLEVLERLPLSAQHSLYLVRVDQGSVLLALSPSGCGLVEISLPARAGATR